jgi:hypothetical protein
MPPSFGAHFMRALRTIVPSRAFDAATVILPLLFVGARTVHAQANAHFQLIAIDSSDGEARATPFGLRMGLTVAELRAIGALKPVPKGGAVHRITRVPHADPEFTQYAVVYSSGQGLCKVIAAGRTIETRPEGTELKAKFASIEAILAQRYGKHLTIDSLRPGSRLTQVSDWTTAVGRKERTLAAYWEEEEASPLPSNLSAILLETVVGPTSRGYVKLTYEFANYAACSADIFDANVIP